MKWEGIGGPIPSHGRRKLRLNNGCGPRIGRRQDATRTKRRSKQQSRAGPSELASPHPKTRSVRAYCSHAANARTTPCNYSCHSRHGAADGPDRQADLSTVRRGPRPITRRSLLKWASASLPLSSCPRASSPSASGSHKHRGQSACQSSQSMPVITRVPRWTICPVGQVPRRCPDGSRFRVSCIIAHLLPHPASAG